MWKPRRFVSLWYGMSIFRTDVSHGPITTALDFPMFTFAPDASSKQCRASCILWMSVGDVTKIVTSSARLQQLFWCDAVQSVSQRGCSEVCRVRDSGTLQTAACLSGTPDRRSCGSVSDWICVLLSILMLLHCHICSEFFAESDHWSRIVLIRGITIN